MLCPAPLHGGSSGPLAELPGQPASPGYQHSGPSRSRHPPCRPLSPGLSALTCPQAHSLMSGDLTCSKRPTMPTTPNLNLRILLRPNSSSPGVPAITDRRPQAHTGRGPTDLTHAAPHSLRGPAHGVLAAADAPGLPMPFLNPSRSAPRRLLSRPS